MKKTLTSLAVTSLLAASAVSFQAAAVEGLSANVGVTSNYLWRGLEQTGGDAAVSGGIDYEHNSGAYAGTWVSNAWGAYELDLYGGFANDINDSMSYDVGFIYYAYPDGDDADFSEIYGNFTFTGLTLGVAILSSSAGSYSVDGSSIGAGDSIYLSADYEIALSNGAAVNLHLGSYNGDAAEEWNGDTSIDYGVSLSKDNFTFGLSATTLDDRAGDVKAYVSYGVDIDL